MKTLQRQIQDIGFIEREKDSEQNYISNKCGRDFLYYALNHYCPQTFNPENLNPSEIDKQELFGLPTASSLAWSQVQFKNIAPFLQSEGLCLEINKHAIKSHFDFIRAILFSRQKLNTALQDITTAVDSNIACGIDLSLGLQGLMDHVIFVYGYDEENLYVIDTHDVPKLEYEVVDEKYPFLFKLSKKTIAQRWKTFSRVWKVLPTS